MNDGEVVKVIKVKIRDNNIVVSGHAGMASVGHDIVCAAVSAVTLTLLNGLQNIAKMDITSDVGDGVVRINWNQANEIGKALIDTWYLGICDISREYSDYIQIV